MTNNMSDYDYTTGGDTSLKHLHLIDRGGFGEVHMVEPLTG